MDGATPQNEAKLQISTWKSAGKSVSMSDSDFSVIVSVIVSIFLNLIRVCVFLFRMHFFMHRGPVTRSDTVIRSRAILRPNQQTRSYFSLLAKHQILDLALAKTMPFTRLRMAAC